MRRQKNGRRFRAQILLLQLGIVLLSVLIVAIAVMRVELSRVEKVAFDRVGTVAEEIAELPTVQAALADRGRNTVPIITPVAHLAESVSGVDYVTVADLNGIRVAHPDPSLIGLPVSSDHDLIREGQSFRGVEMGPVGMTLRVKEPIYSGDKIVGTVSVGILQSKVRADLVEMVGVFAPWIIAAVAVGTVMATLAARQVRRIYGVTPEQVNTLLQAQEAVLHGVGDGVLGVDQWGRISLLNGEARRLLGLPANAVGQTADDLLDADVVRLLHSEQEQRELTQNVLSGERILIATRREARVGARYYGYTLTLKDRTELENTLRELRGQRSLTDTLRAQAHEFTNQLHLISGLISIGEVEEASGHLERFSGMQKQSSERALTDPVLSALLNAKQAVAREAGVKLQLHPGSATEAGWECDDDAMTVAANLMANAIEAAGDGGMVDVRINAGSRGVRIVVGDSGPGIAPEDRSRIVELGFSSKENRGDNAHGRGIGLTLIDRIVTRRGGVLQIGDSDQGGAEVIVAWPLRGSEIDVESEKK